MLLNVSNLENTQWLMRFTCSRPVVRRNLEYCVQVNTQYLSSALGYCLSQVNQWLTSALVNKKLSKGPLMIEVCFT